jgi:hypothetical protein
LHTRGTEIDTLLLHSFWQTFWANKFPAAFFVFCACSCFVALGSPLAIIHSPAPAHNGLQCDAHARGVTAICVAAWATCVWRRWLGVGKMNNGGDSRCDLCPCVRARVCVGGAFPLSLLLSLAALLPVVFRAQLGLKPPRCTTPTRLRRGHRSRHLGFPAELEPRPRLHCHGSAAIVRASLGGRPLAKPFSSSLKR